MWASAAAKSSVVKNDNVGAILNRALDAGQGLLRLTPNWVPRNFLHPGKRIKLAPTDWYAPVANRWSACGILGPTCMRVCPELAIMRRSDGILPSPVFGRGAGGEGNWNRKTR